MAANSESQSAPDVRGNLAGDVPVELFTISCTTCHAALKVRSEAAIGQILACPKCQSMVQVLPPPGWQAASGSANGAAAAGQVAAKLSAAQLSGSQVTPAKLSKSNAAQAPSAQAPSDPPQPPVGEWWGSRARSAHPAATPGVVTPPPIATLSEIVPPAEPAGIELPAKVGVWGATANILSRKVLCWTAGVGALLFALGAMTGYLMSRPQPTAPSVAVAAQQPAAPVPEASSDSASSDTASNETVPSIAKPSEVKQPNSAKPAAKEPVSKTKPASATKSEPKQASAVAAADATDKVESEVTPEPTNEVATADAADTPPPRPEEATTTTAKKVPLDDLLLQDAIPDAATANAPTSEDPAKGSEPANVADAAPGAPAEIGPSAASRRHSRSDSNTTPPDVKTQLAMVVPQIDMRDVPLGSFLDFVSDLTSLPIVLDWDALATARVTPQTRVTVSRHNARLADALTTALSSVPTSPRTPKLTYTAQDERITITTVDAAAGKLQSVKYRVDDLVNMRADSLHSLSVLLESMIVPASWQTVGGAGTISVEGTELVIKQTPSIHLRLIEFCEKLRQARGLPLRSQLPAERFELATRATRAARGLEQVVTCTYLPPTRLVDVLRYLERTSGMTFVVDWASLAQEDFTPASEISCAVERQPLHAALDLVLTPLDLDWRVLDRHTIEVFCHRDAQDKASCEFYPLATLVEKGGDAERIVAELRRATAPQLWREGGGSGVWHFDAAGTCLIVLQADSVQAEIAALLADVERKLSADR